MNKRTRSVLAGLARPRIELWRSSLGMNSGRKESVSYLRYSHVYYGLMLTSSQFFNTTPHQAMGSRIRSKIFSPGVAVYPNFFYSSRERRRRVYPYRV